MSSRNVTGNTLQDVYRALLRHKRKSALLFVTIVAGTLLYTLLSSKEYRSEGKLFLRLGRENATLDPTATLGQSPTVTVPSSRENEINSVVEILESRVLFEKVVDGLGPKTILNSSDPNTASEKAAAEQPTNGWIQQASADVGSVFAEGMDFLSQFSSNAGLDDREKAIQLLSRKVKVEAGKKSNVIEIAYEGPTPAQCQSVVAKLIDSYLDEHLRLNRTQGSHQFLADQTRRLREDLSRKEAGLRDLKNQTGLASPSAQRQLLVARIGRLEDELLDTEATKAAAQARVQDLREKLASLPNTQVVAETTGYANEGTDRMRDQFYALQVREKEAQAKYSADHPKLQQLREQVAAAREILGQEERQRKQVTKEPGRLYHQAQLALLSEEPTLASLEAHAKQLRTQLTGVQKDLVALNENELRIASLQRDVDLLDADYRKYSNNLEQTRIDQQLEVQRMSNVGIVQPASFEPRPIRPRKLTNLLLGICAGLFGGLALPLVLEQLEAPPPQTENRVNGQTPPPKRATVPQLPPAQFIRRRRRAPR